MSSWGGFSVVVQESLSWTYRNGEIRITATIHHQENKQSKEVGKVFEQAGFLFPKIELISEKEQEWEKAVFCFTGCSEPEKFEISSTEFFYYLISLNEWEELYLQDCEKQMLQLVVFEEIIEDVRCRTGVYKAIATPIGYKGKEFEKGLSKESEDGDKTIWKKHIFQKESDFRI